MPTESMASYLRSHRLKSGMSQRELAELIGFIAHYQVSVHERSVAMPSLMMALSYQAVFRVPVSELFSGLYETIRVNVEVRLAQMEKALRESSLKGRKAQEIARQLEWILERNNPVPNEDNQWRL